MLTSNSGTQFDPQVVETFVALLPEMEAAVAKLDQVEQDSQQSLFKTIAEYLEGSANQEPEALDYSEIIQKLTDLVDAPEPPALHEFGERVCQVTALLAPCDTVAVYLADPLRDCIAPIYVGGKWTELFKQMQIAFGEGLSGYVTKTGEPQINAAAHMDLGRRIRPGENLEFSSALSVPLLGESGVIGSLTLYHGSYNLYQPYHQERMTKVAEVVVRALRRSPQWIEAGWPSPSDRPEAIPPSSK
jgi:hypothetical protein